MEKLLSRKDVLNKLQISRTTLWRLISKGMLPEGIKLSERTIRWKESIIQEYIEKLSKSIVEENKNG